MPVHHESTAAPRRADAPGGGPGGGPANEAIEAVRALARASRMLERASSELSLAQYRVLAAVAAGDERASRIADRLALGKPTISATVDSLCQRDLLNRGEVAGDQRAAALTLTPAGRRTLDAVEAVMVARLVEVTGHSPDPDGLLRALVELGSALEDRLAGAAR